MDYETTGDAMDSASRRHPAPAAVAAVALRLPGFSRSRCPFSCSLRVYKPTQRSPTALHEDPMRRRHPREAAAGESAGVDMLRRVWGGRAGVCQLFEQRLKELNPSMKNITYDIADLYDFIDAINDMSALVYNPTVRDHENPLRAECGEGMHMCTTRRDRMPL